MSSVLFEGRQRVRVIAIALGERIDTRPLDRSQHIAASPLLVTAGTAGCAAVFRYGTVVLFGLDAIEEVAFLSTLEGLVREPYEDPPREATELRVDPVAQESVDSAGIVLKEFSVEPVQIVADILAKSVILDRYERAMAVHFDRIEPLAENLKRRGKARPGVRHLLRDIGEALLIEHKMVHRVEVGEKPELLWDRAEFEPLYNRLVKEYELRERRMALERKLELVSRTVETVLDLLNHGRSLRVEWYIVILIVVEIVLTLYQMWALP